MVELGDTAVSKAVAFCVLVQNQLRVFVKFLLLWYEINVFWELPIIQV